jgi:GT2 family glycosyltransferase
MEEIDLCWRLKNQGYKVAYQPQSVVFHLGGGTLSYNSPKKVYLNFRNNLFMLFKNLPRTQFTPHLFCTNDFGWRGSPEIFAWVFIFTVFGP